MFAICSGWLVLWQAPSATGGPFWPCTAIESSISSLHWSLVGVISDGSHLVVSLTVVEADLSICVCKRTNAAWVGCPVLYLDLYQSWSVLIVFLISGAGK